MSDRADVVIVGAGASGLAAAVTAASHGARVTLLEAGARPGRKLLAAGNGRCNLTNMHCSVERYCGADPSFVTSALSRFPPADTVVWFRSLGVSTRVEEEGRVYPVSGQASTVLDVLRAEVQRLGVELRTGAEVDAIRASGGTFTVVWRGGQVEAERVIVAPGGMAAPHLGGNDSGLRLMKSLGHTLTLARPALAPLKTDPHLGAQAKGVRAIAVVRLEVAGQTVRVEQGEVQFREYGLSGIPVMNASLAAGRAVVERRDTWVVLDLAPESTETDLREFLRTQAEYRPELSLESVLAGLVHKRLVRSLLTAAGVAPTTRPVSGLSAIQTDTLVRLLKGWRFRVTGTLSWPDAQVMAGGVSTQEFNPATLESRRMPGLFAAGEVLDIAGECGGYNLQWAWASGRLTGIESAHG